jgi:hypothetical protein
MDTNPTPPPASSGGEKPEEYIRTFSGDLDTFQKGGTPGLAPFNPSEPPSTEASSVPVASKEPPAPTAPVPQVQSISSPATSTRDTREEYIRTFAGDMDIVQKGGTPGLAPLKPFESLDESPGTLARPLIPIPEPISAPPAPMPMVQMESRKSSGPIPSERLVAASPIQEAPIVIPALSFVPEAPPMPAPSFSPNPIETYAQDFRDRVKDTHASTATILAAEQDAGQTSREPGPEKPASKIKNILYITAGVLMLGVGATGAYIAYSRYIVTTSPVSIPQGVVIPIFVDSRESVSGTGNALVQTINQSVRKPLASNTIQLISLDSVSSSDSVFAALAEPTPSILTRNLSTTGSMAGIVNTSSGQSPFFILSVSSYSATFSGMLSWEPSMQKDLAGLFPLYPEPVIVVATTTATKATAISPKNTVVATTTNALLPKAGFRDEVVSNHDVRIYRDLMGRSILLYGYWNQTTLVIARDPVAFSEIIGRLSTSHTQ